MFREWNKRVVAESYAIEAVVVVEGYFRLCTG